VEQDGAAGDAGLDAGGMLLEVRRFNIPAGFNEGEDSGNNEEERVV
jgi:hypothetical protein